MKTILLALSIFFVTSHIMAQETAGVLKNFEYDGCTMFVEGPSSNPNLWGHCCFEHDLRFWFGGTTENREFANLQLHACVKEVAGSFWANLIYNGVQSGGSSPFKHKYRWSWAWVPEREKNKELTTAEIEYVTQRLNDVELDSAFKEEFTKKYLKK